MKKIVIISLLVLGVFISTVFASEKEISWVGCGISRKAFMEKLAEEYTKKTGIKFRMSGGGATKGIRYTSDGKTDLGGSCRHLLVDERNRVIKEEANVDLVHVAWDALVIIVHKSNKINNLTSRQLKDILKGKITNWSQVGGKNQEIKLMTRTGKISGVGYMTRLMLLNDINFEYPSSALVFESSGPLEKNIEGRFEEGLGITGISSAKKRDLKILSIDGVYPDKKNIGSGKYPYYRPLYLVVGKKANKDTQDFVDFVLSDEGQEIISKEGTVNLKEGDVLKNKWKITQL